MERDPPPPQNGKKESVDGKSLNGAGCRVLGIHASQITFDNASNPTSLRIDS